MAELLGLPPQTVKKRKNYNINNFKDLMNAPEEAIADNLNGTLYVENIDILKDNINFLKLVIDSKCYDSFSAKDLECLKFIENNLSDKTSLMLKLIDDFEQKDRNYIDVDYFEKSKLMVPISYLMWNVQMKDDVIPSSRNFYLSPGYHNGFTSVSKDFLLRVKDLVAKLNTYLVDKTEEEKILLISNYLQNTVQFVNYGNISVASDGVYITDSNGLVIGNESHGPMAVLDNGYGVCEGIAAATNLLLNNPIFDINTRFVYGDAHAWNAVKIGEKFYYVDNTWAITRNPDSYAEALKAKSLSTEYLLFGLDKANAIGHHNTEVVIPEISKEDYPQDKIQEAKKILSKKVSFDNYKEPVFVSRIQR